MNKSFDGGQSGHYLPPINRYDSGNISKTRTNNDTQTDLSLSIKSMAPLVRLMQLQSLASLLRQSP